MKILFLSNYYPPHSLGGYEQWCQEVAEALAARGHEVHVLTSTALDEAGSLSSGPTIHRKLHLEVEGGLAETMARQLTNRRRLEQENVELISQLISEIQPDAALIWGMWNVPRSVPATVEALLPERVAYYICDYWLTLPSAYVQRWQEDARRGMAQRAKQLLARPFLWQLEQESPVGLALERPICVSQAVRDILVDANVPVSHAAVIYGGTQVETFVEAAAKQERDGTNNGPLRLVFGGRLRADKGIETVIRGLAQLGTLIEESKSTDSRTLQNVVCLDIYGGGDAEYVDHLRRLVDENDLGEVVTFCGLVPRAEMPARLVSNDVFIFASEWEEPFARSVLEAMAAGLTVVGTTTGGTGEILAHEETGLTYPAGDDKALAEQLLRLVNDRTLLHRLASQGQQTVLDGFRFERMVDEIEQSLYF